MSRKPEFQCWLADALILAVIRRRAKPWWRYHIGQNVGGYSPEGKFTRHFIRFKIFWWDEFIAAGGTHSYRPPWYRPFNVFLHKWSPKADGQEQFHDHPRWTITICLRGKIVEHTPWGQRTLRPGSVVIRSHKAIHAFTVPHGYAGKTWTLFIAGRRDHKQNTYYLNLGKS